MMRILTFFFAWLSFFIAQPCNSNVCVPSHSGDTTEKKVFEEFYHLTERAGAQSPGDQIVALQRFLYKHADFEPVYLKLLERYVVCDQILEAVDYFRSLLDKPEYRRNSHWMLAKIFTLQHDSLAAFKAYEQALNDGAISIGLLRDFIKFDQEQSEKFNGRATLKKLPLRREIKNIASAFSHYEKDAYGEAIQAFLGILVESRDNVLILEIWGDSYYRSSQYPQADSLWRAGLILSRQAGNLESEAQFLANLGTVSLATRDYDQASQYCDSAFEIAKRINDLKSMQLIEGNWGHLRYVRGDYAEAAAHYKKAEEIAAKSKDEESCVNWLTYHAQVFFERGNLAEALQTLARSEAIAQKLPNNRRVALDLLNRKGMYYSFLGQREYAKEIFQKAYDMALGLNLIEYQYSIKVKLARFLEDEQEYEKARTAYQEFIGYLKPKNDPLSLAYWIGRLANTYLAEKRYDLAKKHYFEAYKMAQQAGSKPYQAWYLLRLADIEVTEENCVAAIEKFKTVLATAEVENNQNMLWQVFLGLGNAHKKTGNLAAAISAYTHAVDIIEVSRKNLSVEQLRIGYFSQRNKAYQQLAACFLERFELSNNVVDLDSLFYFVEMGKNRALQDQIAGNANSVKSTEYLHACEQLRLLQRHLRQQVDKQTPAGEVDELLLRLDGARYSLIQERLQMIGKDQSRNKIEPPLISPISEVLKGLQSRESGLLLYDISEEASFVFVATPENVRIIRLQLMPSSIAAAVDSLMEPFHVVSEEGREILPFRAALAHRLYQWLVQPIEQVMTLPPRLIVVPDLALINLPFEMLLVAQPIASEYMPSDFPDYADQFLAQRYIMAYSPSASILSQKESYDAGNSQLLVLANPSDDVSKRNIQTSFLRERTGWLFNPLPYAEVEAEKIQELYSSTKVNKRANATKAEFIRDAPLQRILHLATHAFVDTVFDDFSGLVLAMGEDSTDDGLLMGYEIADLNLRCDLITLSACETGRGKLVAGEGVLGLPRLFLGAGAKTVLMTLWKVEDKFASRLMPSFYDNFLNANLSKSEALAQAKRSLLSSKQRDGEVYYQHPFYWASFALYGDPGTSREPASTIRFAIIILATLVLAATAIFCLKYLRRNN